jgi:glutaredoxin
MQIKKVYCAFCRLQRNVYAKKHVDWTNVLWSFLVSLLVMIVIWGNFEPKFLVFFAITVTIAEVFVHVRWRMGMPCPHCSFDPVLYKTDRAKAAQIVKQKLEKVRASGKYMLRQNNPFEKLPVIKKEPSQSADKQV